MTTLEIKQSPVEGKGLFTLVPRVAGEIIGIALLKTQNTGDPDLDYKQTETGRFINHSEIPNIEVFALENGQLGFKAVEDIEKGEELLANYKQFEALMDSLNKFAKDKYVKKRKEESGNITYIYSDKHIEKRNKAKAQRIQKLSKSLGKVRAQVKKDLKATDLNTRYTALAIALIDETFERIGNDDSASEMKHYGVSTWCPKHIKFSGSKATISYVGKSGVKQKKEVKDAQLTRLLKEIVKGKGKNEKIFVGEGYFITANKVNDYLHKFDITAKDIRGFHANDEMRAALKTTRSKGPKLPAPGKERETLLKKEFKEALEEVADIVGHKPSTLKNQYLVPGMFTAYTEKGTIISDLTKGAEQEFILSKRAKLESTKPVATLFHHLHHDIKKKDISHEEHHCGGDHPDAKYTIKHCKHNKHAIDKKEAVGHATDKNFKAIKVKVLFTDVCEDGWWHIESGKKIAGASND